MCIGEMVLLKVQNSDHVQFPRKHCLVNGRTSNYLANGRLEALLVGIFKLSFWFATELDPVINVDLL